VKLTAADAVLGGDLGSRERIVVRERTDGPSAAALPIFPALFGVLRWSWAPIYSMGMIPGRCAPTSTAPPCGELLLRLAKPATARCWIGSDAMWRRWCAGTPRGLFVFSYFFRGLSAVVPGRVYFPVSSGGFRVCCITDVLN
jgi:hypothetical protein